MSKTYEHKEESDQECHSTLDIVAWYEEGSPADHDEQRAGQVVGDHVMRHSPLQNHLEAGHAVVA